MEDDDYTLSASDRLAFSQDTVDFDTVIAGQPTSTYSFMVYNKGKKAIRLASVSLGKANSPYYINVDGAVLPQGSPLSGIEVGAEDSIRVLLFANMPTDVHQTEVAYEDLLTFVTEGGAVQKVVLKSCGQNVNPLRAVTYDADQTLTDGRPYQVFDSLVVAAGATLTLDAGARLYFHPNAKLIVRGRLQVNGTLKKPVQLRGDRLDNMFAGQPYDRIPGQWGGVVFAAESYGNVLQYADIHSADFGILCEKSDGVTEKLKLENSVVHNMTGDCLTLNHSKVFVGNSQITNAGGNCVTIVGGDNTFVHTTIANFYAFTGGRGIAVSYANREADMAVPLTAASFLNCIVTGYSKDEISGVRHGDETTAFNYRFQNCLLNTPEIKDDANVVDCLWENEDAEVKREDNFAPKFDLKQLIFTFGLAPQSQARNKADVTITQSYYPLDRNGKNRMADGNPDTGCYEGAE